ncbi:glutamate--cysteine ligase [Ferrimonas sp. SCSIO 43195]|uniref:glutamate--cysteine ligase n=1 Tax=Ferrimonas sp. SCSIO 43195 TaxID=2822844 RepID=UPI00207612BB|nr:glutamate--cysteine ligase [Ferrimonas sp. SCSIO 43195]USD38539.1 glutamate--cysteine ligase [Ferrimonas sp. SCSIO 43195]
MTEFEQNLSRLAQGEGRQALQKLQRGIEREALRILPQGALARDPHPEVLGSALTNKWITTDFSESLLELITGVNDNVDQLLAELGDVHHFVSERIDGQYLWPQSMPCFIDHHEDVPIAQYGDSHVGRMKTLYREGLKRRYGAKMQSIAGVHFNFSLPKALWKGLKGSDSQEVISDGYFHLIRNFRHQAWVLPYLFGASPTLCPSFLEGRDVPFEFDTLPSGLLTLPYATSLRMSDLGYTNSEQANLQIRYNSVDQYVADLKRAITLPSAQFAKLGIEQEGQLLQLNANILQIENELYSAIRPKRTTHSGETPSDALARAGVEYIEVRTLDVNPFEPLGIGRDQILLLDLFLLDCALLPSPCWTDACQEQTQRNFETVVIEGRKPGLLLEAGCGEQIGLAQWLQQSFDRWSKIADVIDGLNGDTQYQDALTLWRPAIAEPEHTLSGRLMAEHRQLDNPAMALAKAHNVNLLARDYATLSEGRLQDEVSQSLQRQRQLEQQQTGTFEAYLKHYFQG